MNFFRKEDIELECQSAESEANERESPPPPLLWLATPASAKTRGGKTLLSTFPRNSYFVLPHLRTTPSRAVSSSRWLPLSRAAAEAVSAPLRPCPPAAALQRGPPSPPLLGRRRRRRRPPWSPPPPPFAARPTVRAPSGLGYTSRVSPLFFYGDKRPVESLRVGKRGD